MNPPAGTETGWEDTHRRILTAAAGVFAKNGYTRATTRTLAAAAGVTEVTLFRHFPTKLILFETLVAQYGGTAVSNEIENLLTGDYRQDMQRIGDYFMTLVVQRSSVIRMMLCEASHFPEVAQTLSQNPRILRQTLARYLEKQVENGVVRPLNCEAAANALWGMFFTYGLSTGLYDEPSITTLSPEEMVRHYVDLFIEGTLIRKG